MACWPLAIEAHVGLHGQVSAHLPEVESDGGCIYPYLELVSHALLSFGMQRQKDWCSNIASRQVI